METLILQAGLATSLVFECGGVSLADCDKQISLRDTAIYRDYAHSQGCPKNVLEDEVFIPWREGMRGLIAAINANNPSVGWFAPSCEEHVISGLTQGHKYDFL